MKKMFVILLLLASASISLAQAVGAGGVPGAPAAGSGVTSVSGTANQIDVTNGTTTPVVSLDVAAGITGQGAQPNLGISLSPYCPSANTGACYQTPANTRQAVDCQWTSGSPTVTCASSHFTAADTGKRAFGFKSCNAFQSNTVASVPITTSTALTLTYVSATSVTLSGNAANTQATQVGCFIWGNPDDTAAAAVDALLAGSYANLPFCPKILLASANYMFTVPHFFSQPTACAQGGSTYQGSLGNIFYHAALEVEGRGMGATAIYVTPGFPETGTCNNGPGAVACFVIPLEGRWSDFQITGGWNMNPPNIASGKVLVYQTGPSSIERFVCMNWGGGSSANGIIGIQSTAWSQQQQVDNSGCGAIGWEVGAGGAQTQVTAFRVHVENSFTNALLMNGVPTGGLATLSCYECAFVLAQGSNNTSNQVIVSNPIGASLYLNHSTIEAGTLANTQAYRALTTNGATLTMEDSAFQMNGTTQSAIVCVSVTCNNYLHNVSVQATNRWVADTAGSYTYDQGGNKFFGSGGNFTIFGNYFGEANSQPTAVVAANLVLSAGWGSTAAVTAPAGANAPINFTVTNSGTGQAASPTITYTFPNAWPVAPFSCTATQTGGTNAVGTFTSAAPTTTGVVFTYSLTPTASDTEIIQVSCVTP